MPTSAFPPDLSSELQSVVARYVAATKMQRASMLGARMEMEIDGRFTSLRESGKMRVIRSINRLGEMVVDVLDFKGDNRVKTELIARYLEAEEKEKAYGAIPVTPADYDFRIKAIFKQSSGRSVYVFDVNPRTKAPGRFRGQVSVDGATGMPLREAGRFVQSPHILLTNLQFARDYELLNGISIMKHFRSSTDVRLLGVGTAELDVNFSNFSRNAADAPPREERL